MRTFGLQSVVIGSSPLNPVWDITAQRLECSAFLVMAHFPLGDIKHTITQEGTTLEPLGGYFLYNAPIGTHCPRPDQRRTDPSRVPRQPSMA